MEVIEIIEDPNWRFETENPKQEPLFLLKQVAWTVLILVKYFLCLSNYHFK